MRLKHILIFLFAWNSLICQIAERHNSNEQHPISVIIYLGLRFFPNPDSSNQPIQRIEKVQRESFYLNGLPLSKEQLISMNLNHKHLSNDSTSLFRHNTSNQGFGTYTLVSTKDTLGFDELIYQIDVSIPIYLNGELVIAENQSKLFAEIDPGDIKAINLKKCLFRSDFILIYKYEQE